MFLSIISAEGLFTRLGCERNERVERSCVLMFYVDRCIIQLTLNVESVSSETREAEGMFFHSTALIGLLAIVVLYVHFRRRYRFWRDLGVAYIPPTFPTGNVSDFLKSSIHFSYVIQKLYVKLRHRGVDDYAGIYFFGNPVFLVLSPEFAKTVLVRDFHHFMDRGIYFNAEVDVLSANIFFLRGGKWKALREKLTPTFSSGKLKQMFFTILDVGRRLEQHLLPLAEARADVDVRDILGRFMTDVIASCAFGLETDCIGDPKSRFREMGKRMIQFPKSKALKLIFASTFQKQARALGIRWNDEDVSDFFMKVVKDTIAYRKTSGVRRNDFMQLLIDMMRDDGCAPHQDGAANESKSPTNNGLLTLEEIAAQAFLFFFAGSVISLLLAVFFLSGASLPSDLLCPSVVNLSACCLFILQKLLRPKK